MSAKALREQRAPLARRIEQMAETARVEGREFSGAESELWRSVNADYDALTQQIGDAEREEIGERAGRIGSDQRAPANGVVPGRGDFDGRAALRAANDEDDEDEERAGPSNEDGVHALAAWVKVQSGLALNKRQKEACRRTGVNPARNYFDIAVGRRAMTRGEKRAMSAELLPNGGTLVQPGFAQTFEKALLDFSGVREVADILRTDTGAELSWPTVNDTMNEGRIVSENQCVPDTDVATGVVKFGAFKYTSDMIKVPVELLEDAAFDLASEIGVMAGERIGRRQNRDFTTGDGAGKPLGFLNSAMPGVTTAGPTAITYGELQALEHSVDPAYRNSPKTMYMFNDSVLLYLRQLTDASGKPLWQTNVALGAPDTINGRPVRHQYTHARRGHRRGQGRGLWRLQQVQDPRRPRPAAPPLGRALRRLRPGRLRRVLPVRRSRH